MKELKRLIAEKADISEIKKYMLENDFVLREGKIVRVGEKLEYAIEQEKFWDLRQSSRKVVLNSGYGAIINPSMRFADVRIGQSTTMSGRSIVKHMNSEINSIVTGEYDYKGAAIIAVDTDSGMFSAYEILKDMPEYSDFEWSKENVIALYDGIGDAVNQTFAGFMMKSFNTSIERGKLIKAGREYVASAGLFVKKKKYAVLMYDKEGFRLDVDKNGNPIAGKLKAMGLDLKRSDTPKFMQKFLEGLLMDILTGASKEKMFEDIKKFRKDFVARPGWEKGMPKKVSNLSGPQELMRAAERVCLTDRVTPGTKLRVNVAGHARAAMEWNKLCDLYQDKHVMRIMDGSRIIVCTLKPNAMKISSIAYPVDEPHLPEWFKELPFDHEAMQNKIVNAKLENLVGTLTTGLKWDLSKTLVDDDDELISF